MSQASRGSGGILTTKNEHLTSTDVAEAIRRSATDVFSTMLAIDVAAGETIVGKTQTCHRSGIVALLGLTGERSGTGQFYCQPGFACKIASVMLMAEYETVNEDVLDAVAEVANMIVGNIKNILEAKLGTMGLSTPNIVFGGEFDTRIAGNSDQITVPFHCEDDTMSVQVVLAPRRETAYIPHSHRTALEASEREELAIDVYS